MTRQYDAGIAKRAVERLRYWRDLLIEEGATEQEAETLAPLIYFFGGGREEQ